MEHIDDIKKDDIKTCAKLYQQVFNEKPWKDNWSFKTAYQRLFDIFMSPHFQGMVYRNNNGEIMGAVFGNLEQNYDGIHYNLKEIFVDTRVQGKGIGTKLLHNLEDSLKNQNVKAMILFTSDENRSSRFYLKNHFYLCNGIVMMGKDTPK